jgi:hypothetical protein
LSQSLSTYASPSCADLMASEGIARARMTL